MAIIAMTTNNSIKVKADLKNNFVRGGTNRRAKESSGVIIMTQVSTCLEKITRAGTGSQRPPGVKRGFIQKQ